MDCWDPAYPVLKPLPYNVKLGADNPDNLYLYGSIRCAGDASNNTTHRLLHQLTDSRRCCACCSGRYRYRIHGHRGTVPYLSFASYAGNRPGEGSTKPGIINSSQLKTQEDGSFEASAGARVFVAYGGPAHWSCPFCPSYA